MMRRRGRKTVKKVSITRKGTRWSKEDQSMHR
jgi:hypothetical protein